MDIKAFAAIRDQLRFMTASFDERPLIVIWEITRSCALACRHCRAEAIPQRDPHELRGHEVDELIDQVAEAKPLFFVLTGGDPAMRPDLVDIVARATARGLRVAISPSATPRLLHCDFQALRRAGVERLSLSLDGARAATHDAFRGVSGTFENTLEAIALARKASIEVQINSTFSRHNVDEFPDFVRLLDQVAPSLWSVFLLVPTGRAAQDALLSATATEDLLERLADHREHCSYPIKTTEAPHFRRIVMARDRVAGRSSQPWSAAATNDGKGFVFISHLGEIQPSGFLPLTCGNARTERLLDVYRDHPHFRTLRNPHLLQGKCGACSYRSVCGGSRSRAYAMYGDFMAEDPACAYQPIPQL